MIAFACLLAANTARAEPSRTGSGGSPSETAQTPEMNWDAELKKASLTWLKLKQDILQNLNRGLPVESADKDAVTVQLRPGTYVISDANFGMFIASSRDGVYSIAWEESDDLEPALYCKLNFDVEATPGWIGVLPDTGSGDSRFYVASTGCWFMGISHGFWLRVLRLHDGMVTDEFHGPYEFNANLGDGEPVIKDGVLHVMDARGDKTFWRGGSAALYDWGILVEPEDVKDLGRVPMDAERHAIDELFDRVYRGKPASNLASGAVIAKLHAYFAGLPKPKGRAADHLNLGELIGLSTKADGSRIRTCISFNPDQEGNSEVQARTFHFTMTGKGGHRHVTGVKIHTGHEACGGVP